MSCQSILVKVSDTDKPAVRPLHEHESNIHLQVRYHYGCQAPDALRRLGDDPGRLPCFVNPRAELCVE